MKEMEHVLLLFSASITMPPRRTDEEMLDLIQNEGFWEQLEALSKIGKGIQPEVERSSRKLGKTGTLKQRVDERCLFAEAGLKLASIVGQHLGDRGPAFGRNPGITNGMTESVKRIEDIVINGYAATAKVASLSQVASFCSVIARSDDFEPASFSAPQN